MQRIRFFFFEGLLEGGRKPCGLAGQRWEDSFGICVKKSPEVKTYQYLLCCLQYKQSHFQNSSLTYC